MPFKLRLFLIIYLENGEKWPHERGKMLDLPRHKIGAPWVFGVPLGRWLPLTATTLCPFLTLSRMSRLASSGGFFFGGVLHKIHPGRFNGWFTYSHHPWKRKENDLNQNLQGIMFHFNLPGCTQVVHSVRGQAKKMAYLLGNDPHIFYQTFRTFWVDDFPPFSHRECEIS